MAWKKDIEEIFDLATLHSWCNQVNELLYTFRNKYQKTNELEKYIIDILTMRHLPNEHYIISIILLNFQNYPTNDIIELAISSLYSKLNNNDILFLKEHLFPGGFPLSSDLSEDITNRAFLSPKVAIKKAMQINTVISKNNPINTVFFMSLILSRMDMNEENRAMVAFLLLRIDEKLPKNLNEKVYKYLLEYKDIIKELLEEETGKSSIVTDVSAIQEKLDKIKTIEAHRPGNGKNKQNFQTGLNRKIKNETPILKDNNLTTVNPSYSSHEHVAGNSINTDKQQINIVSEDNRPEFTKINVKLQANKKPDNIKPIKVKHRKFSSKSIYSPTANFPFLKHLSGKISNKSLKKIETFQEKLTIESDSVASKNINSNYKNIKHKTEKEESILEQNSWQIDLKDNKKILENILNGVTIQNSIEKPKKKKNLFNPHKITVNSNFSIKKTAFITGAVLLLYIALFFTIGYNRENNTNKIENSDNSNKNFQKQKLINSESVENELKIVKTETKLDTENIIPGEFPYNIAIVNNQIVWKVKEGESITGLYSAIKEFNFNYNNTVLEKLANMEWNIFFEKFKKSNPVRKSYHLIFPGEEFVLPLE